MIKTAIKIDDINVEIPSGWHDVTMGMFIRLIEPINLSELFQILTKIDIKKTEIIPEALMDLIISPCRFWIDEGLPKNKVHQFKLPDDIQQMEFARRINAEYMLKNCNFYVGSAKLLSIYLATSTEDEDIDRKWAELMLMPCIEVIAAGEQLMEQYKKLCEAETKMPKPMRRAEEIRANIKELDKFGIFAFVDGLAGGDILKHDEIYKQSYSKVMLKSRMNIEVANYQMRLSEILNPVKKK